LDKLPFIPGQFIKRSDIHDLYKGNRQSGISPSATHPFIFIFTGVTGEQYGYKDGWDNPNIFSYTGEGQVGDMKLIRGNLALKNHVQDGKRIFLFESKKTGFVEFITELEFYDVDYFETNDLKGVTRLGIKFFFKRKGAFIPISSKDFNIFKVNEPEIEYTNILHPNTTERSGFITSRVGQGAYRKRIIHRWQYRCAVTGFDKLDVLVASHIVPWSQSNNDERLDVHNGILLSPTYDALFDRHLITFNNNGKIVLSNHIEEKAFNKIGVTGNERIDELSQYNLSYISRHKREFEKMESQT
jgi:5-methylcytosine-specific restriction protein A